MKILISGFGELGKRVKTFCENSLNEFFIDDLDSTKQTHSPEYTYDILFICFPYSPEFFQSAIYKLYPNFTKNNVIVFTPCVLGACNELGFSHATLSSDGHVFIGGGNKTLFNLFSDFGKKLYVMEKSIHSELLTLQFLARKNAENLENFNFEDFNEYIVKISNEIGLDYNIVLDYNLINKNVEVDKKHSEISRKLLKMKYNTNLFL